MIDINIVVTGVDARDNPYPGLSLIRAIRESKEFKGKIIVLTYDALCTGVYSPNLIDEVFLVPYPSDAEENLFSRLKEIHQKIKLDLIIPALDSEIATYARIASRLSALGITTLVPKEDSVKMRSKISLGEFCKANSFNAPQTLIVKDINQISSLGQTLGYPVVIKGSIVEGYIANNEQELHVFGNRLIERWGYPLIMQEVISGEEFDVAALADRNSNTIGALPMKKIGITDKGKACVGATIYNEELIELAKSVIKKLNWVGPLEVELVKESTSGKFCIIEINARFPTWIYLSSHANYNLPLALVKVALGDKLVHLPAYRSGMMFARITDETVCSMKDFGTLATKGELSWRQKSLRL